LESFQATRIYNEKSILTFMIFKRLFKLKSMTSFYVYHKILSETFFSKKKCFQNCHRYEKPGKVREIEIGHEKNLEKSRKNMKEKF